MNLFKIVKESVTVKQTAALYGLPVTTTWMTRCPFHEDHTPSMKLNDTYYYCFGCGATGDVIDLTAQLFGLSSFQAARKLTQDFGLSPDKPPSGAVALPKPAAASSDTQQEEIFYCLRVLHESVLKKLEDAKLQREYEEALAVLERIPPEVLEEYAKPKASHRTAEL